MDLEAIGGKATARARRAEHFSDEAGVAVASGAAGGSGVVVVVAVVVVVGGGGAATANEKVQQRWRAMSMRGQRLTMGGSARAVLSLVDGLGAFMRLVLS